MPVTMSVRLPGGRYYSGDRDARGRMVERGAVGRGAEGAGATYIPEQLCLAVLIYHILSLLSSFFFVPFSSLLCAFISLSVSFPLSFFFPSFLASPLFP